MPITPRSYIGLLVLGLGTLVAPLDSAVNIAFPRITGDFGVPLADIRWVIICYVLTHTSLMLVFGKLGDLFGHKRIFTAGLALSLLTFTLCAVAWTFEWLLVFRVAQGVSAALVMSCGPALATSLFPEQHRARVLGAYITMFGIGAALGPSVGGALVAAWGWPAVFWFRAPIALAALLMVFVLPTVPRRTDGARFDTTGGALAALAMASLLLCVTQLQRIESQPAVVAVLILATIAAVAFFIRRESRHPAPMIRLEVFRRLDFTVLNLANMAINFVGFAILLLVPYFLARATSYPVALSGLILALSNLGMVLAAPVAGWMIGPVPAARLALGGMVLVIGGALTIGRWGIEPSAALMAIPLLATGVGLGAFQVAYMNIVTGTLPPGERGVAGSLAMLTRTVGIVGSASLLTWLFSALEAANRAAGLGAVESFLTGFGAAFDYAGGFLLLFLIATLMRPRIWLARS